MRPLLPLYDSKSESAKSMKKLSEKLPRKVSLKKQLIMILQHNTRNPLIFLKQILKRIVVYQITSPSFGILYYFRICIYRF